MGAFFLLYNLDHLLPVGSKRFLIIVEMRLLQGICQVKAHRGKRCQCDAARDDTAM